MDLLISQVKSLFGPALSGIALLASVAFAAWIKKTNDQRKRNAFNELDLANRKISFDVKSKPLPDLVSESNKSHGAQLGQQAGVDDKKK